MPKIGMEPIRREALVEATIAEIGAMGSLDVTVSQIARRAGMSSALAHHYFGGKEQIFAAAMRHILREFGGEVRRALALADSSRGRVDALISACFAPSCFAPVSISAWMSFYQQASSSAEAGRLLRLYHVRLRRNLTHALRPLDSNAERHAESLAAMIDGLYIRAALTGMAPTDAEALVKLAVEDLLGESE